jgi:hypothetical protein
MDNGLRTRVKSLKFVEEHIASDSDASESYKALQANGLKNTVRFAELIGWVVITVVDKKRLKAKSLKTEAYFPTKLGSMADAIEKFSAQPLFVPDSIEHNELPARLRSYAEQLQERLKFLKQNGEGRPHPTTQALSSLRWLVETQTNRKASPTQLAKILNAVLDAATADAGNPPMYDFEANLKKIAPIPSLAGKKK